MIINPLGEMNWVKKENIIKIDIGQDTEIQYLDVAKQTNIYVKYTK